MSREVSIRIYVDSNVFLTVWYDKQRDTEHLESSINLFEGVYECRYTLVVSNVLIREIGKVATMDMNDVEDVLLKGFRAAGKLEKVKITLESADEAVHLSSIHGIHKLDALHAALARVHDCTLITFDNDLKRAASHAGIKVRDPRDLL